eukprot:5714224-Alexandrium_andersonii.AAC.1
MVVCYGVASRPCSLMRSSYCALVTLLPLGSWERAPAVGDGGADGLPSSSSSFEVSRRTPT